MIINLIGSFTTGYVGETSDETHLAREMMELGHAVRKITRDEWREHVLTGQSYPSIPQDLKADINIICKWHHFDSPTFIQQLREKSGAPVFYWVWDYMYYNSMPQWHMDMVQVADLYLGNDVRAPHYQGLKNCYYFPFDVADNNFDVFLNSNPKYDVVYFGSCLDQGNRKEWITQLNKHIPVRIYSWNYEEWQKLGFDAHPAVYGMDFNLRVGESKICLGFSVEPNCWGYWSNRVGKTLLAGGFLLYQYAPGMELFLGDAVDYFSTQEELLEKVNYYLNNEPAREDIRRRGYNLAQGKFSSKQRVKELMILVDRYLKTGGKEWQI